MNAKKLFSRLVCLGALLLMTGCAQALLSAGSITTGLFATKSIDDKVKNNQANKCYKIETSGLKGAELNREMRKAGC